MRQLDLEIRNPSGLHARPAALFVRTAAGFRSRITIANLTTGGTAVDAKSILGVLAAGAGRGAIVRVTVEGEDEAAAADALEQLVASGIGEEVA